MPPVHEERVGDRVRSQLALRELSQASLAQALGHNQQWVSRRLTGDVAFSVDEVIAIARFLEIDVAELLPRVAA